MKSKKVQNRQSRKRRIRARVFGTQESPRLCVFVSNKHIFAQVIDDTTGKTLVSASDYEKGAKEEKGTKTEIAERVGAKLAERARGKKISKVVFDRGGKLYHGRVKSTADGARKGGLEF